MSSLARRMRATAAVAGITAAGVGLAGPALAAPAAPERPSTDDAAPAPDTRSTPNILGDVRRPAPTVPQLPKLFTVDDTSVYTADHALPQLRNADELPTEQLPSTSDAINLEDSQQGRSNDVEFRTAAPREQDGAMQQLDAASMFGDVPRQLLGTTEGNEIRG